MIHFKNELQPFFEMCCNSIGRSKAAQEYLQLHGLTKPLEVGFNTGKYHWKQSEEFIKSWMQAGLLRLGNRGSDYLVWARRCLIFPLKNKKEEVVGVYGRSISEDAKKSDHYQIKREGLYPNYPKQETKTLILVSSVIEAATLGQLDLGIKDYSVLALFGLAILEEDHQRAISDLGQLEEIVLVLSGADESGNEKLAIELKEQFPNIKLSDVNLPEDESVNSLHISHIEESEALFKELIAGRSSTLERKEQPKKMTGELREDENGSLYYLHESMEIEVLGGIAMESLDKLQVSLKIGANGKRLRHRLDLYNDDQVEKLSRKCSEKIGVSSNATYAILQSMTDALEEYRQDELDSRVGRKAERSLNPSDRKAAIEYLAAPDLMQRTGNDLGRTGIIGEEENRLTMLIVMSSRKRQRPLHVMNLASSGSGKTHLLEGVSACIPEEDKIEMTSLSDNALYYFGEDELKHKLMLIEDLDGAGNVLYPLRELQSKRKLSRTVALKDKRGKTKTINVEVDGPVCVAGCTTRERIYEDNANRSFLLYLDEGKNQDNAIMNHQRLRSCGKVKMKEEHAIRKLLQNTQRLLRDVQIRNRYAEYLKIPEQVFKPRRTNAHYLDFIEAITFYHQYQRETKVDEITEEKYIETTLEDIRWANKLLAPILLRKSDELSGACRSFLECLKLYLQEEGLSSFRGRAIRQNFRFSSSTYYRYLNDLTIKGYLKIVGGNRYHQGYEYEVVSSTEYQELQQKILLTLDEIYKLIGK